MKAKGTLHTSVFPNQYSVAQC